MQGSVNEFLKPRVVKVSPLAPRQARVGIEPCERGVGQTLGNASFRYVRELADGDNALLEFETLTGDEIKELISSGKIDRPDVPSGPVRPVSTQGSAIPKAGKRFTGPAPQSV